MTKQIENGYAFGRELALDALEATDKDGRDFRPNDVFAGILTTLMHGLYAIAPTEESAEEIISFSTATALKDWEAEKKARGE